MLNKGLNQTGGNAKPPYTFSDEATKRKIKRHLTDINDVITEKDIKNAKVPGAEESTTSTKPAATPDLPVKPGKKTRKDKKDIVDDTPGNPVTPWDILDE